jgi:hypothetical protein
MGEWTLLSNHGHVLVCLAKNNEARLRDVAADVGITERAVQNILRELQQSGMVSVNKHGRCNHYQVNPRISLRHPLEAHCTVGHLLQLLKVEAGAAEPGGSGKRQPDQLQAAGSKTTAPKVAVPKVALPGPAAGNPEGSKPAQPRAEVSKPAPAKLAAAAPDHALGPATKPETTDAKPKRKGKAKGDEPAPGSQQGSLF